MSNLFVYLLFGHIVGDYFLQPKSMAIKKGTSYATALYHVWVYTMCVFAFTMWYLPNPAPVEHLVWMLIVFIPHFLIDRFSLADKWLQFINGRSLADFLKNGEQNIPPARSTEMINYHILRGGFTSIVYVVVDGGMHLMCLWYGFALLKALF